MLVRCGKLLVVVTLVLSTGAHWAALQTVAWTTMLANNLCTQSVSKAVSNTFDGRHLCPLCKAIAAAKKSGNKPDAAPRVLKMEYPPATEQFVLISPKPFSFFSPAEFSAGSTFQKPPVPPPRSFFV